MTLREWKELSITREVLLELRRRQHDAREYLAHNAGRDPIMDARMVGSIAAYQDMLDIELDEESHDN